MNYGQKKDPVWLMPPTKEEEALFAELDEQFKGYDPYSGKTSPETQQKTVDGINEKQQDGKSIHPASSTGQQPPSPPKSPPSQPSKNLVDPKSVQQPILALPDPAVRDFLPKSSYTNKEYQEAACLLYTSPSPRD